MPCLHNKSALLALLLIPSFALADAADSDGDGVLDLVDNCSEAANTSQLNTDGDRYGNLCDPDFNNDGQVNFQDLALLQQVFFLAGVFDQDMNGDGLVNFQDLFLFSPFFFSVPGPAGGLSGGLEIEPVFTTIAFESPIAMKQAPGDDAHWYVAERAGRILRFDNVTAPAGATVVLDITDKVDDFFEGGLLGFAFDPDFASNGRLFVSYTASGSSPVVNPLDSRLSLFTPDPAMPDTFDPESELVIIEVDQRYGNHNGGDLAFGPDGFIYLSLGDGGSANDPDDNGQDNTTLHGSILRLDVDLSEADILAGITYRIPPGNPFSASPGCPTGCPEIFALGFRNPWRMSFDTATGELITGDVGQNSREEIDLVTVGGNYGWRCYEGNLPFILSGCEQPDAYIFPLIDYSHTDGSSSVTGGYVYRGADFPALDGVYLYGDFVSGKIWGLVGGKSLGELVDTSLDLASFAQGNDGEVYALDLFPGAIYRLEVPQ